VDDCSTTNGGQGLDRPSGLLGLCRHWVLMMKNLYGWSYFDNLEKNRPQIGARSTTR